MEVIMKIKLISLLALIFLGAYAPQNNAMYRTPLNKLVAGKRFSASTLAYLSKTGTSAFNQIKSTSNQFGSYIKPLQSFFYGAVIMQNPEIEKTVVLLSDIHRRSEVDKVQKNEVIDLAKELEKRGQTVHVLVEDTASFLATKDKIDIDKGNIILSFLQDSPLLFLVEKCKKHTINSTNVEFRDWDQDYIDSAKKQINSVTDPSVMQKLFMNYSDQASYDVDSPFLDAYILYNIKANDASTILVCAGGMHTASVAKILYQQGYTNADIKESDSLHVCIKSLLHDFDKDEPIAKFKSPYLFPTPLLDLKEAVLGPLEESLKKHEFKLKKQKQRTHLKRLDSHLYQAFNQF